MKLEYQCAALEAVLFAAGEPMETDRIAEALGMTAEEIQAAAGALMTALEESGSGLQLLPLGESWQLTTRADFAEEIRAALEVKRNTPLSNAAMEALTIIAYNQPVTKGFVERVRGVDSGSVVNTLVERGLLEEAGRIEVPGRPVTYRTTAHFLRAFGMQSLADLPPLPTGSETEDLFEVQSAEGEDTVEEYEDALPELDNLETVETPEPDAETDVQ
ncbi:MAG: SMC-Scp complex subunit ScpB [Oscillospiraceae bacterium]|nr:SMC-Scp complex subunit ScpB [Oscillospiraceae bacterium]